MFTKQHPNSEIKRLHTQENETSATRHKLKTSSKDLYNEALAARLPLKQLRGSTKILSENRQSFSKIRPASKRAHNLLEDTTCGLPLRDMGTTYLNHNHSHHNNSTLALFNDRRMSSRNKSNVSKNSIDYNIVTDRCNVHHNNQENINCKGSAEKTEKSLSLKKLRSDTLISSRKTSIRQGNSTTKVNYKNDTKSNSPFSSMAEEQYQRLLQQLADENRSLKKSLLGKNSSSNYVTLKVEDIVSLVNMYVLEKAKYKQAKEELDFLKNELEGSNNSVLKILRE